MTIPKFENEADEANWAYENREGLSAAFHEAVLEGRVRHGTLKGRAEQQETDRQSTLTNIPEGRKTG